MSEPSKLKILAWRFFFWVTPRWLSRKYQVCMLRLFVKRYPDEVERKIREALAQPFGATRSEEELAALSKDALDLMLHPEARKSPFSQIGPHPERRRACSDRFPIFRRRMDGATGIAPRFGLPRSAAQRSQRCRRRERA